MLDARSSAPYRTPFGTVCLYRRPSRGRTGLLVTLCLALLVCASLFALLPRTAALPAAEQAPIGQTRYPAWRARLEASPARDRVFVLDPALMRAEPSLCYTDAEHPLPDWLSTQVFGILRFSGGTVQARTTALSLTRPALGALIEMLHAVHNAGFTSVCVYEAARTAYEQDALFRQGLSAVQGRHNPHLTGCCVDLCTLDVGALRVGTSMHDTQRQTITAIAPQYGFVTEPCPEGQFHLRYVGRAHALAAACLGLDYPAYLSCLHTVGQMTIYENGVQRYSLYAVPTAELAAEGFLMYLPAAARDIFYGEDNLGYTLVACAY